MSTRTTRSRSSKIPPLDETEEQPKIRDVFKVTRNRAKPTKKLVDVSEATVSETVLPKVSSGKSLKRVKKEASVPSDVTTAPATEEVAAAQPTKSELAKRLVAAVPAEHVIPDSPPHRTRKTPTASPNTSPQSKPSTARKALVFTDENKVAEDSKLEIEDSQPQQEIVCPVQTGTRKAAVKIKTVAQLQEALALKGAAKRIHKQKIASQCKQVDEHVQLLKSPQKKVPAGIVCLPSSKSKSTAARKEPQQAVVDVPEYVLPTYKTPVKERDSEEEREVEEKNRAFEYGKASRLISEVKQNSELPLPAKYQSLLDTFQSCDRIVSIYTNQGRRCVLTEIQKNVQKNTRRDFTMRHMAQLLHVYPKSYSVRMEEQWHAFGGTTAGKYEHVLSVNLTDDLTGFMLPDSPIKTVPSSSAPSSDPLPLVLPGRCLSPMKSPKKKCAPLPRAPELDQRPRLEGWRMVCRSHVLRHLLIEKVKDCYVRFMNGIGAPLSGSPIRRFHPKFIVRMDEHCPELEQAHLEKTRRIEDQPRDMRAFMESVDDGVALPRGVDDALRELKSPVKSLMSADRQIPLSPKKFAELQASKPKGTMSLLERIRAKEQARRVVEDQRDPAVERKRAQLEGLVKKMLRTLLCIYTQRNCRSMELSQVVEKMEYSTGGMGKMPRAELINHLDLLCSVAPSHFAIKEVVGRKYLQVSENDYHQILGLLKKELESISSVVPSTPSLLKGR